MKRAFADIPEGQMHYRYEGNGDPILLLHPGVGSSDAFTNTMPYMSGKYLVIAPDFLGNGDSDPAPDQYTMLDHARSLRSFMDSLGIKKASVVGHHTGAKVAAELVINWPERVNKLVLSAIGYWEAAENIEKNEPTDFTSRVEIKPDGSHLMEWWRRAAMWGDPLDIVEASVLEYIKAGPRGEEIHWTARAYDTKGRLPLIKCPTLVLSGAHGLFHSAADNVRKLIPGSKLAVIENGPPRMERTMPEEFAATILNFLGRTG
ncbi:MAG: alpha/beta fold hydrolase [Dehalococcoidales bacterium]